MGMVGKVGAVAGLALSMMSMGGCAIVCDLGATGLAENIEGNAATLNEAHTRAMTAIIAINVVRARDRWPTNYTTLSRIKSNPTLSLNGLASFGPLGLGNAPMPFAGDAQPWYIDGEEFPAAASAIDAANPARYFDIIRRAKRNEIDSGPLPSPSLDQCNCKPYDPAYLRETLGGPQLDGGRGGGNMVDMVRTVEGLTGRQLVFADDTRAARSGEPQMVADRFNRRLLLCDPVEPAWGFINARTGAPIAAVRTRSFDDMIYFLGETLRNGTEDQPTVAGDVILFQTYPERQDKSFAVRVEHAGRVYFIAPQAPMGDTDGPKDMTGNVLSLLNQLYLLAQSDEFLRAPEGRLR